MTGGPDACEAAMVGGRSEVDFEVTDVPESARR
jgi:hypothetical protein